MPARATVCTSSPQVRTPPARSKRSARILAAGEMAARVAVSDAGAWRSRTMRLRASARCRAWRSAPRFTGGAGDRYECARAGNRAGASGARQAQATVRAQLDALGPLCGGPAAAIASAHVGLLDDDDTERRRPAEIERGRSAARHGTLQRSKPRQLACDRTIRCSVERIADLDESPLATDCGFARRQRRAGIDLRRETILIADDLLPSELMSLPRERHRRAGDEEAGATSHVAIIAASFGVPTLVAMGPDSHAFPEGAGSCSTRRSAC